MNAVTEAPEHTQTLLLQTREQFSLAPRNLTEAMEFAKLMAESELVPKNFRNKPGDVLIAVQMGSEVGLAAMAAIQNIAVVNGKPGLFGDAGKAILLANGCDIEEDDIRVIKEKGYATCTITRKGKQTTRTYGIDNAKTAGLWNKEGPWRTNPERQMAWRAFWFAARDAAADLLKGLGGFEELRDYPAPERDISPGAQEPGQQGKQPDALPAYTDDQMKQNKPTWEAAIKAGKNTADGIIQKVSAKYTLNDEQKREIRNLGVIDGELLAHEADVQALIERAEKATISQAAICKHLEVESLDNLTIKQLEAADAFLSNPAGQ